MVLKYYYIRQCATEIAIYSRVLLLPSTHNGIVYSIFEMDYQGETSPNAEVLLMSIIEFMESVVHNVLAVRKIYPTVLFEKRMKVSFIELFLICQEIHLGLLYY